MANPLRNLTQTWLSLLVAAKEQKEERFGKYANETYKFYNGPHNWMWRSEYAKAEQGFLDPNSSVAMPRFWMSCSKVSDAVDLFGPSLMHKYPEVLVEAIDRPPVDPLFMGINPQDPNAEIYVQQIQQTVEMGKRLAGAIALHKQAYLNWLQERAAKKDHAQRAITECIVKGHACGYTELHMPQGSQIAFPRSSFLSVDDLLKDPDARNPEGVTWIAVRHQGDPVNKVEQKFNLPPGTIKGHLQSRQMQSTQEGKRKAKANGRTSHDLVEWFEIYSKNGAGQRLKTGVNDAADRMMDPQVRAILDSFGDYTYLAVARGIPYPLNLPPEVWNGDEEMRFNAAQWPIPFWRDDGSFNDWPVTELIFREDPEDVWGVSIFKPVIGWIRFANWALSFLADKVAANGCDYFAIAKAALKDIQEGLASQVGPFKMIALETSQYGDDIRKVISLLEKPPFDIAIWNMVKEIFAEIDKGTGLSGILYGMTDRQMRSAAESNALTEGSTIRPAEMSARCDAWYADMALKEVQAACWLLDGRHVEPALGRYGAQFWDQYIRTQDFSAVSRDYRYKLVANSARKHNRQANLRALLDFGQVVTPALQAYAMQGQVGPWNWYTQAIAKELEIKLDGALLPEPPPPDPNQPQPPSPEEVKAQAIQQKAQIEQEMQSQRIQAEQQKTALQTQQHQVKTQAAQQDMQLKAASAQQDMQIRAAQAQLDQQIRAEQARMEMQSRGAPDGKAASVVQDMQIKAAQAAQGLQQASQKHALDMTQTSEKMRSEAVRAALDLAAKKRQLETMKNNQRGVS